MEISKSKEKIEALAELIEDYTLLMTEARVTAEQMASKREELETTSQKNDTEGSHYAALIVHKAIMSEEVFQQKRAETYDYYRRDAIRRLSQELGDD